MDPSSSINSVNHLTQGLEASPIGETGFSNELQKQVKPLDIPNQLGIGEHPQSTPDNKSILERSTQKVDIENMISTKTDEIKSQHLENESIASDIQDLDRDITNDNRAIAEAHSEGRSSETKLKSLDRQLNHDQEEITRDEQQSAK